MNPIAQAAERRRRLLTRAIPISALAAGSFLIGVLVGREGNLAAAERFVEAWERQDYRAMHAELTADAQRRYPLADLQAAYQEAEETASVAEVTAGEAESVDAAGEDVAAVEVTLDTHAFGRIGGDLELPLSEERIAWEPHMAFPGLRADEKLTRQTRTLERAPILARDGTPLAEGPASSRSSPLGAAALAVAGDTGEPEAARADELAGLGYPESAASGVSGLELAFDERLAGQPGGQLIAAPSIGGDGDGRVLVSSEPVEGLPVRTTIDPELQQAAVATLGGTFGGIAALDAKDGSLRAVAGLAFSAPQPPGSTFKIVTTVAALDDELVKLDDQFPVQTSAVVGGREIANAHDEPCGGSFVESFAHSCNSVFAPLGAEVGSERLVEVAERFGFNSPPTLYDARALEAVELPSSALPTKLADDLEVGVTAIGQGEVLATPLQLASMAQTIANGGMRSPTSLVRDRDLRSKTKPVRVTSEGTANTVRDLMIQVVTSGTGRAAALPNAQVAGKTGTAELGPKPLQPGQQPEPGEEPEQEVDAWFTAFAPARAPRLAVAVMVVNAPGDGGEIAAPLAREVLAAGLG